MELFQQILAKILEKEGINIVLSNINMNTVEMKCYKALRKIKKIIENDRLSDFDCIEEIVCV